VKRIFNNLREISQNVSFKNICCHPGPALAGAGSNAKIGDWAPLSCGVMTSSCAVNRDTTFLMMFLQNNCMNIKICGKLSELICISSYFFWRGMAHVQWLDSKFLRTGCLTPGLTNNRFSHHSLQRQTMLVGPI